MSPRVMLCAAGCVALSLTVASTIRAEEDASGDLIEVIVGLLSEKDKELRSLGLEQVRTGAKGAAATKLFAAQLSKLSPDAQVSLLSALAGRGDSAARSEVLKTLAASKNEAASVAAIRALGSLGNVDDLPVLLKLLSAQSKAQQAAARGSLKNLPGEKVSSAIATAMKGADPGIRITMIQLLAARRALDTIDALLSVAVDSDAKVRAAAMKALGQLATAEHLAGMVQGVLKAERGRERSTAEKNVMFVCGRIADAQKRAEPLLAAMAKLKEADRLTMLSTLGRVGGDSARKTIEKAIADSRPEVHELGVKALCNWPNAKIAARLTELANTDKHPGHRIAALRALIRVAPLRDERTDAAKLELLKKAMTMATRDQERDLALSRAHAIRIVESLRFLLKYTDDPKFAQRACLSIVELSHHRGVREPNKKEFHKALDKVIATSKDAVVIDRANRYKKDQTWVRPKR